MALKQSNETNLAKKVRKVKELYLKRTKNLKNATYSRRELEKMEPKKCQSLNTLLTLFQPGGGGGGIHPPPGFSFTMATKINRSTPDFLTFNFYYQDIIGPKIKLITCQGIMWSLFCRKHFVSPHIFHCIFIEFSCSTFSFSDIYIQC